MCPKSLDKMASLHRADTRALGTPPVDVISTDNAKDSAHRVPVFDPKKKDSSVNFIYFKVVIYCNVAFPLMMMV